MAMANFSRVPTVTVRRALGIKARRAGAGQICMKGQLKGKTYSKPPAGTGGRNNILVRRAFYQAAVACFKGNVKKKSP